MSPTERRKMIPKENTGLSLTRQCKLLRISRSSTYYTPVGFDPATIDLIQKIDRIFTKYPFFESRQSRGPIRFGAATSPTSQSKMASVSGGDHGLGDAKSTDLAAFKYAGMQASALRRWRRPSRNTASLRS